MQKMNKFRSVILSLRVLWRLGVPKFVFLAFLAISISNAGKDLEEKRSYPKELDYPDCEVQCQNYDWDPLPDGTYAYCNVCSMYITCVDGVETSRRCVWGSYYFDRVLGLCVNDSSVCLNDTAHYYYKYEYSGDSENIPSLTRPPFPTSPPDTTTSTTAAPFIKGYVPASDAEAETLTFALDLVNANSQRSNRVGASQVESVSTQILTRNSTGVEEIFYRFRNVELMNTTCSNTPDNMGASLQRCPLAGEVTEGFTVCDFTVRYFPLESDPLKRFSMFYMMCRN